MLTRTFHACCIAVLIATSPVIARAQKRHEAVTTKITVTINRGRDRGQNFGSLFEATSDDGSLVLGAGFQNLYNTRYRADRHAVQFFIRPSGTTGGVKIKEGKYASKPVGQCLVSRFRSMKFPSHGGFNKGVTFPLLVQ